MEPHRILVVSEMDLFPYNNIKYQILPNAEHIPIKLAWFEHYADLPLLSDIIIKEIGGKNYQMIKSRKKGEVFLYPINEKRDNRLVPLHSINRRILCQLIDTRGEPRIPQMIGVIKDRAKLRHVDDEELWLTFDIPESRHVDELLERLEERNLWRLEPQNLKVGRIVLKRSDGEPGNSFVRVKIDKIIGEQVVIFFVDWGNTQEIALSKAELFEIPFPLGFYPSLIRKVDLDVAFEAVLPHERKYLDKKKYFSIKRFEKDIDNKRVPKISIHTTDMSLTESFRQLLSLPDATHESNDEI